MSSKRETRRGTSWLPTPAEDPPARARTPDVSNIQSLFSPSKRRHDTSVGDLYETERRRLASESGGYDTFGNTLATHADRPSRASRASSESSESLSGADHDASVNTALPMVGDAVGSYRLEKRLGTGGMGAVFLGRNTVLDRRAAIKFLRPELSEKPGLRQRLLREAKAAAAVEHESLVKVFDVGQHGTSHFILMEYLEGESLSRRLRRDTTLSVSHAICIATQIARALAAVHARGIIHRDLKPGNIILVPDRRFACGSLVKIIDFGVAKLTDSDDPDDVQTRLDEVIGTPHYMAPEQLGGPGPKDHRLDVYALGCMLFEMVAGRRPFVACDPVNVMLAHRTKPAPRLSMLVPTVPPGLDEVITRALCKQPEDRWASMEELADALDACDTAVVALPVVAPLDTRDSESYELIDVQANANANASPAHDSEPASEPPPILEPLALPAGGASELPGALQSRATIAIAALLALLALLALVWWLKI